MSETRTLPSARALEPARWEGELPPLVAADRIALRLGLALILWGQRHDASHRLAQARAEAARRAGAHERAARSRETAFQHRSHAGPTW